MRRLLALAVPLLALPVAVAVAQSSPPITVTVVPKVTPSRAGTPRHPQGVRLDVRIKIGIPVNYEPPLISTIDVWFPRGGRYNGARFPSCSYRRLNVSGTPGCPPGSIMGSGDGVGRADTSLTYPKITVVNGGPNTVFFYTVLNNPARVQTPVRGTITKLSGIWSYKLHIVIPKSLQVVVGVPIVLQTLHISAGRGDWLATTYCPPNRQWAYQAVARFTDGQSIQNHGAVSCH